MRNIITYLCLSSMLILSCKKDKNSNDTENQTPNNNVSNVNEMRVPLGFKYETIQTCSLNLSIKNTSNLALKYLPVSIMEGSLESKSKVWLKLASDANGLIRAKITLPSRFKQVIINSPYLGIPNNIILPINNGVIQADLGGSKPNIYPTLETDLSLGKNFLNLGKNPSKYSYKLGSWNSLGVPTYLMSPNDVVSSQLLTDIHSILTELTALPPRRPDLLDDSISRRYILLNQTADVYVTFVFEGAGFKNTLFYYVYNKNNPPASINNVDSLYIIYPNTSFSGSGGGLATGNKVKIGRFGKDTVIAFGIVAHGYNATTNTLGSGNWYCYGNKAFNPETNPNLKQHMVLLYEAANKRFVMAFEDMKRDLSGCDQDFNDVIFYTTSNPVTAVDTTHVVVIPGACPDTDGDGITDCNEDYPNDANRAYNNYYGTASVVFEDLWPSKGDYDLNDVVVDYRYQVVTNAANKVKDVKGNYTLRASGGMFENNFAVEFPTLKSNIQSITGLSLEAAQTNAVVKVFSNMRSQMPVWNTDPLQGKCDTVNYAFSMTLTNPVDVSTFGINEYNPFIWTESHGHTRGYEIHLPRKQPTILANQTLFGSEDDDTNIGSGKTYLSKNNLPWAINIAERFEYPVEKQDVTGAYLKFATWAQSGGALFTDWYKDLTGYRTNSKIYK